MSNVAEKWSREMAREIETRLFLELMSGKSIIGGYCRWLRSLCERMYAYWTMERRNVQGIMHMRGKWMVFRRERGGEGHSVILDSNWPSQLAERPFLSHFSYESLSFRSIFCLIKAANERSLFSNGNNIQILRTTNETNGERDGYRIQDWDQKRSKLIPCDIWRYFHLSTVLLKIILKQKFELWAQLNKTFRNESGMAY